MKIRQTKLLGLALLLGGLALVGVGLWLLLSPAQYAATARIKVMSDICDVEDYMKDYPEIKGWYDPYFSTSIIDRLRSDTILTNVVDQMHLNEVWGKERSTGSPIKTTESTTIIRKHLRLTPIRNSQLIDITFSSTNPNESYRIANAVGETFCDWRINRRKQSIRKGIEALQQQYQDEEKQLQETQAKVDELRRLCNVTDAEMMQEIEHARNESVSSLPSQPYWEAKRQFNQLTELHKLLGAKIEAIKTELQAPKPMVQIVDRAVPPQSPIGPNRTLGAVLLAAGLLSLLAGILLLKPSRQPAV
ncbi:MAG: hypothetical protein WCH99_20110 [Verrucomicrobiota bacterium]